MIKLSVVTLKVQTSYILFPMAPDTVNNVLWEQRMSVMGTGSSHLAASYVEASRYWNIVGSKRVTNRIFQEWWSAFCPLSPATKCIIIVLNPCLHTGKTDLGNWNFVKPFHTQQYGYRTACFIWEVRVGWVRLGYISWDFLTDHI